jgi:hypothetical protein
MMSLGDIAREGDECLVANEDWGDERRSYQMRAGRICSKSCSPSALGCEMILGSPGEYGERGAKAPLFHGGAAASVPRKRAAQKFDEEGTVRIP